jgi:hypothetical protein
MSDARPLLRDLITIPGRVQTSDFALELAEGVTEERAAATIRDYVVPTRSPSPSPLRVLTSPAQRER